MTQLTLPGTEQKYGFKEEGCWFDGHRGIYMGEAIIDTAIDHGFTIEDGDLEDGKRYADHEFYHELWEEAEDFMQAFALDGYYFGTSEGGGDWGLWAVEEDEEEQAA